MSDNRRADIGGREPPQQKPTTMTSPYSYTYDCVETCGCLVWYDGEFFPGDRDEPADSSFTIREIEVTDALDAMLWSYDRKDWSESVHEIVAAAVARCGFFGDLERDWLDANGEEIAEAIYADLGGAR